MNMCINVKPKTVLEKMNDATPFNECLKDKTVRAKIVEINDGDSFKVIFPFYGNIYKWNCRLANIYTPDIHTPCKIEKSFGIKVRDVVKKMLLNKMVEIKCHIIDRFGHLLIDIYHNNIHINQWLIEQKYALVYESGKKKSWKEYLEKNDSIFHQMDQNKISDKPEPKIIHISKDNQPL